MTGKQPGEAPRDRGLGQAATDPLIQRANQVRSTKDLANLLRALRRRHARDRQDSELTYRELAARTGWSHTAIAEYLTGRTLPPTDRLDALLRVLGASTAQQGAVATARDRVEELRRNGQPPAASPEGEPGGAAWPVPRQLPAAPPHFVGRAAEVAALLGLADQPLEPGTVMISAVAGMAGVGKTALAVYAAHRLAERFPDGQLFVDLHGFTAGVPPVEPADALDRLLRGVGVPGERNPAGLDERAALWRSVLAGRRMLIVLDNAATEAQVQPLLPGAAGCLVLVTSRRRLTGLEASNVLSLDTLPEADAVELFVHTASRSEVVTGPPEPTAEVVQLCGRLPLAIRIAAARLRHRRVWTVADLLERLRDVDVRLSALDDGQRSVHATLHLTYEYLSPAARRLYRLLGLHPGPDVDEYAAAALAEGDLEGVRRLLDGLVDDHLLAEPVPGRYQLHDLVRAHASDVAAREDTKEQQRAALDRLLDHYQHTAATAMGIAYPSERHRPTANSAGIRTPALSDRGRADQWLDTELTNLLAVAYHAGRHGSPEHTWQLAVVLDRHLRAHGRSREAETLHQYALDLARRIGNHPAEMEALNSLGYVDRIMGRHKHSARHYRQALQIAQDIGDSSGQLDAEIGLGDVFWFLGRCKQSTDHYGRALRIAREIGDLGGERQALTGLGDNYRSLGRYEQSTDHYCRALKIAEDIGDRGGESMVLAGLGYVDWYLGRYEQAVGHLGRALRIAQLTGNRLGERHALAGLGHVHRMLGRYEQSSDYYEQVLRIAQDIGHRAGELQALTGLGDVHRISGRYSEAAGCYHQVLDLARELGNGNWQFEALHGMGRLQHATGRPDLALTYHEQALQCAKDLAQAADQARAHDGLAHANHALNQHHRARQHWQHALDILGSLGTEHTEDVEATVSKIHAHLDDVDRTRLPAAADGKRARRVTGQSASRRSPPHNRCSP